MKKDKARAFQPKHKQVARQPAHQTMHANATPRLGQGSSKKEPSKPVMSPYHRFFASQKSSYPSQTASYDVGRTRRV